MKLSALFLVAAATCQQGPTPGPTPPSPPTPVDAGAFEPPVGSACAQACAVLSYVGCPEGLATPRDREAGQSDQQSCERVVAAASAFPGYHLPCLEVAACRDVDCVRANGVRCGAARR